MVDARFKGLLSPARYRLALPGGRLLLALGSSIRGSRADVRALMHTSRQFAGDTPLGLVTFLGNFQTACDGSGSNEGTAVTLLQYFVTSEVLGVLQRAEDNHATRHLTYKRAGRAVLNEYLDGDDLVDHLQSLMQATRENGRTSTSLRTASSMLTVPWARSCKRPSSRLSYSRASDERSG